MKHPVCMQCGSTNLIGFSEGGYRCRSCGRTYTAEEAKRIMMRGLPPVSNLSTLRFGRYFTPGKESTYPIQWLVLAIEGDRALCLSKYALDCQPYHTHKGEITWEDCYLREWLNTEFLNAAFTPKQQEWLIPTTLENADNPEFGTRGGNPTTDKIFCLSIDECRKYLPDEVDRVCHPIAYAEEQGTWMDDFACLWWLRSPGFSELIAAGVDHSGGIDCSGDFIGFNATGVRPAMWLNVNRDEAREA